MFKPQSLLSAALVLTLAAGATLAQAAERNVFDTDTHLRMPAAVSAEGLTRDAVQAQYLAQRAAIGIASFNPERDHFAQNTDLAPRLMAWRSGQPAREVLASADGRSRAEVRAEVLAARASGELNPFDTETYPRFVPSVRSPAPTALAQR